MGEHGRQRIATEWNYEREFLPILERLAQEPPRVNVFFPVFKIKLN
jgi:hypothetical protein